MEPAALERLVRAWLAFARAGDDADAWAWEALGELPSDPAALEQVVRALVAAVPEGDAVALAFLVAGPLDTLLDVAAPAQLAALAADARNDEKLARALREVARSRAVRAASDRIRAAAPDDAEVLYPPPPRRP